MKYQGCCLRALEKVGPIEKGELVYCFVEFPEFFIVNVMVPKYGIVTEIKISVALKKSFKVEDY